MVERVERVHCGEVDYTHADTDTDQHVAHEHPNQNADHLVDAHANQHVDSNADHHPDAHADHDRIADR